MINANNRRKFDVAELQTALAVGIALETRGGDRVEATEPTIEPTTDSVVYFLDERPDPLAGLDLPDFVK